MTIRQEQFVVDKEGNRIGVVLNIEDYQKLLADVEELESIRAFDKQRLRERNPSLLSELLPRSKPARNELLPFHPADRVRIISERKTTRGERKQYEEGIGAGNE